MKKVALIALTMVLGLSGCASSGTSGSVRQDRIRYGNDLGGATWESVKQDWLGIGGTQEVASWGSVKQDRIRYWSDPGGASWESVKQDCRRFWN